MEINKYTLVENGKPNLFFDMDGVMAEYNNVPYKVLYEKNYFYDLKPIENTINSVKELLKSNDCNVYILSSVLSDSEYALDEKREWLHKYIPELKDESMLFTVCGLNKRDFINKELNENDILIDDYTPNLKNWSEQIGNSKGQAIKFINNINNKKGTWKGKKIDYKSENLCLDILKCTIDKKHNINIKESNTR